MSYRPNNSVVGTWLEIIYEELCNYCEAVRMPEDLLLETLASYKKFQTTWSVFVLEEDPEILRRATRDISFRTKGISKRKVSLIFSCMHTPHLTAPPYIQGKKAVEKISGRIGYINL